MARFRHRALGALGLAAVVTALSAIPAMADGPFWADTTQDGSRMNLFQQSELRKIKAEAAAAKAAKAPILYEYASVTNCGANRPDSANPDDQCKGAAIYCAGNTAAQGLGPSVRLFRRQVDASGQPKTGWEQYGVTCFPEDAPGAKPMVTMAMVLAAFHDTAFAKATLEVQPKGNVTLVTLPTYFEVRWPQSGYEPGEIDLVDPVRMAGFRVEIRPLLKSISYIYGDGSTSNPTTSLGGPYPEGNVTKAYVHGGDYSVRADVTYNGQFRVGNGEWIDIPGDVTIRGTPETLTVKTAKARLVTN